MNSDHKRVAREMSAAQAKSNHMWQVDCNYKRDNTDTKCPLCKKSEDNTEHVLECGKAKKFVLTKENSRGEWEEITEIYRKNKKKRERAVIKVQG